MALPNVGGKGQDKSTAFGLLHWKRHVRRWLAMMQEGWKPRGASQSEMARQHTNTRARTDKKTAIRSEEIGASHRWKAEARQQRLMQSAETDAGIGDSNSP
jgi:hypothetical protein